MCIHQQLIVSQIIQLHFMCTLLQRIQRATRFSINIHKTITKKKRRKFNLIRSNKSETYKRRALPCLAYTLLDSVSQWLMPICWCCGYCYVLLLIQCFSISKSQQFFSWKEKIRKQIKIKKRRNEFLDKYGTHVKR